MKYLVVLFLFLINALSAEGAGPFTMQITVQGSYYENDYKDVLSNPVCYAISHQKRLDMIVEVSEKLNPKELKIMTKRVVVDPYAFGLNREGALVLHGRIVEDKWLKEVTVKFAENKFDESNKWSNGKAEGFFSGLFKLENGKNLEIKNLTNIVVVQESHFDIPKEYKGFSGSEMRVICQLPMTVK